MPCMGNALPTLNDRCVWFGDSENRTYPHLGNLCQRWHDARRVKLLRQPFGKCSRIKLPIERTLLALRCRSPCAGFRTLRKFSTFTKIPDGDSPAALLAVITSLIHWNCPATSAYMLPCRNCDCWHFAPFGCSPMRLCKPRGHSHNVAGEM